LFHPERSEGALLLKEQEILRFAQNDMKRINSDIMMQGYQKGEKIFDKKSQILRLIM